MRSKLRGLVREVTVGYVAVVAWALGLLLTDSANDTSIEWQERTWDWLLGA